jgi:hypothetical protein
MSTVDRALVACLLLAVWAAVTEAASGWWVLLLAVNMAAIAAVTRFAKGGNRS